MLFFCSPRNRRVRLRYSLLEGGGIMKTWFSGRWLIFAAHAVYGIAGVMAETVGVGIVMVMLMTALGLLAASTAPDALFESPRQIGWVLLVAIGNAALVVPVVVDLLRVVAPAMRRANSGATLFVLVFVWVFTGPVLLLLAWIGAWIIGVWFPPNAWMNVEVRTARVRR